MEHLKQFAYFINCIYSHSIFLVDNITVGRFGQMRRQNKCNVM